MIGERVQRVEDRRFLTGRGCFLADVNVSNLKHAAIGNPPDGTNLEHAEIREAQGMRPGGFGIFMARRMVDDLIYNSAGNEVLIVKSMK